MTYPRQRTDEVLFSLLLLLLYVGSWNQTIFQTLLAQTISGF